jgi:hypothetical protein
MIDPRIRFFLRGGTEFSKDPSKFFAADKNGLAYRSRL